MVETKLIDLPLSDRVFERLMSDLSSGVFEMGEKVVIDRLAEQLGVSQTPVREAIKRLVAIGALSARPNHSVVVPTMTPEIYDEIALIRLHLEGIAAERAIEKAMAEDIRALERLQEKMDENRDRGAYREVLFLNRDFHFFVVDLANMPLSRQVLELLWSRTGPVFHLLHDLPIYRRSSEAHPHRQLIRAMRERDPAAGRRAMEEDIRNGLAQVTARLNR